MMQRFALIVNRNKDPELAAAKHIRDGLAAHGAFCAIVDRPSEETADALPPDTECLIVLGGDGTLLQAARHARALDIPLFGVNLGTLGYLAEVERHAVDEAIGQLAAGNYTIEERMMLSGSVGGRVENALNDIVITRSGSLQVIRLTVRVNGQALTAYQADGIIVSTPTGSTGYNLSAGGPIVEPEAQTILLTPISPHTLTNRSIVLSPEDRVAVEIGAGRDGGRLSVEANFDGAVRLPMTTGDCVEIARAKAVTRIVRFQQVSFLEVLRKKLV